MSALRRYPYALKYPYAFARHVMDKIATVTLGALFVSGPGRRLRAALAGVNPVSQVPDIKVALIAHAYYAELLDEILACRAVLPGTVALHVTLPAERMEITKQYLAGAPDVILHPCENRGRDIAPFLTVLGSGALDGYDAVLKLHTKRSPHLLDGEIRRKLLFDMLCGERNAALRVLADFEDPSTGMVGWRNCFRTSPPYWMKNEARVRELAGRMDAPDDAVRLGFFEGSMFWFRPAAFAALRELKLMPEDFEPEERQLDGTLHHAVERCFTIAAWARGFTVRDLRGRVLG
ncbi:rhamnan synthesis protein F [Bosea psychrotolerans]|uniref:Rhamnan synthesis protein F n=1 Tax=Bosea psychrotolerans TaxID=1871628 RepID=A0A2S4LY44_9HYPH|nr:rhamnan synthesis protein F [Bosea psychrotolerans]